LIVIFDASSIVGAALKADTTPMRALLAARARDTLALSIALYEEIREVLGRTKFADALPPERQQDILQLLSAAAIWAEPDIVVIDCPDPDDNKYLELAVSVGASVIVSSDRHLLDLNPWQGVMIIRPAEYLALS
jgi:uncharacterized protein